MKFVRTPATIGFVPNKPRTQHRSVRIDDATWADLEAAARELGLDRAKVINDLLGWWLRRPGSSLPARISPELLREIARLRKQEGQ